MCPRCSFHRRHLGVRAHMAPKGIKAPGDPRFVRLTTYRLTCPSSCRWNTTLRRRPNHLLQVWRRPVSPVLCRCRSSATPSTSLELTRPPPSIATSNLRSQTIIRRFHLRLPQLWSCPRHPKPSHRMPRYSDEFLPNLIMTPCVPLPDLSFPSFDSNFRSSSLEIFSFSIIFGYRPSPFDCAAKSRRRICVIPFTITFSSRCTPPSPPS